MFHAYAKIRRTSRALAAFAAVWVVAIPGAGGAAVLPMTFADLLSGSDTIVHGRVLSLRSHWGDGGRTIYTTVTIQPIDYMKGDMGSAPFSFEMPGGEVGDVRLVVSDTPEFTPNEEVVLFLRDEFFRIVGFRQGKLSVKNGIVQEEAVTLEELGRRVMEAAGQAPENLESGTTRETTIRPATFTIDAPPARKGAPAAGAPPAEKSTTGDVSIMTEDFEGTWPAPGWDLIDQLGTGHLWGADDYKPHTGTYSMWEASAGTNALDPQYDNYPNDMKTWARYGPFDLSDATSAELVFYMSVNTAEVDDHLYWGSSEDGSVFNGYIASGGIGLWGKQTFDLSDLLGDSTVWIAFNFESDESGTDKGVFVDDIELVKTVPNLNPPEVTGIAPGTGPSGVGFSVAVSGSDFGSAQGSSAVRFTKDPTGATFVDASVVTSWSDTLIVCEVPEGASSGPVNVVVSGDPGTGSDFLVTYGGSSARWQEAEPMSESFVVNPNTSDVDDELQAVIAAVQEWNTNGGAAFSFNYGGTTSATTYGFNSANDICWGSTGGAVAATYTWLLGDSILENDLIFDDLWTWSTSTPPGFLSFDVQAVATHELGHWLRLLDLYGTADVGKTMYGRISFGEYTQRSLEVEDKAGIQHMYGAETVNITTTSLPAAVAGSPYSEELAVTGGDTPYSWELRSLSPPPGLEVGADGVISGTPTAPGTYYFSVRVTDGAAAHDSQVLSITVEESTTDAPGDRPHGPDTAVLWQNSPNPFRARTALSFYLPEEEKVFLAVFDASGRLVRDIIAGAAYPAGVHTVPWDGRDAEGTLASSGVYFCRMKAGVFEKTKKMTVAR
jgi:hypothetical protein